MQTDHIGSREQGLKVNALRSIGIVDTCTPHDQDLHPKGFAKGANLAT